MFKKIHSGIAAEIVTLTAVIVAAMSSVLFVFRLLAYTEYVFMSSDGLMSVVMFIVFLAPDIFRITVPIALLFAATITAVKMSHDRELEAWLASGVSMPRMTVMPWILGVVFTLAALWVTLYMAPYSRAEFRQFKWMHARVIPQPAVEIEAVAEAKQPDAAKPKIKSCRIPWARLLRRCFQIDIEVCPHCNGKTRVVAALFSRSEVSRFLTHMGLDASPPKRFATRMPTLFSVD